MTSSTAKRQRQQAAGFTLLTVIAALTIFVIVAILAYILIRGVGAVSPGFLFTPPSNGMKAGGIWPAIVGTF